MPNTEKSVIQQLADSTRPWRQQADEKTQRFDELYIRAEKPETPTNLRKTFEERIKSNMPISQDVAFILMMLLYSGSSYPHLVLADMLLNMVPDDRLTMCNWAVQRDANDLMKDPMPSAISSGKLLFPLFPGTEMDTQNRCLIEDAMGVKRMTEMGEKMLEGGGPSRTNPANQKEIKRTMHSRRYALYDHPKCNQSPLRR
ncbi:hypothetical protein LSM04_001444 [Trypanosoma melophagium]|uniref:uncharacterized protein n=1 Tax=Trypanosoma melophagium TaxID=715481 RepID=UPI003519E7FE|nr:hypothetical protein LSM04_001444 [Trypanosoma melophagium]